MKRGVLLIGCAAAAIALVLFLLWDGGSERGDRRSGVATGREGTTAGVSSDEGLTDAARDGDEAERAGSLLVRVTLEGRPVEGAQLDVDGAMRWRGVTDARGEARVAGGRPGHVSLHASKSAHAATRYLRIDASTETVELALADAIAVRGHVYDPFGEPIAGARIRAHALDRRDGGSEDWGLSANSLGHDDPIHAATTSGNDGSYTLLLPGADRYRLTAEAMRRAPRALDPRLFESVTEDIDFYLERGVEVSGHVRDEGGAAVAGARVRIQSSGTITVAVTDAEGAFRLDASANRSAFLAITAEGFAAHRHGQVMPPALELNFTLARGVRAKARFVCEGEPATGVQATMLENGRSQVAEADADGMTWFDRVAAPEGKAWRTISAAGGGFVALTKQYQDLQPTDGVLDFGEIELVRGAVVRGRVTEQGTGAPIEGAMVRWWGRTTRGSMNAPLLGATSDAEGRYELTGVPLDVIEVFANKDGFDNGIDYRKLWERTQSSKEGLLPAGQRELTRDIELARFGTVRGQVLHATGDPVAGAVVTGQPRGFPMDRGSKPAETTTGEDGRFELRDYASARQARQLTASHPTLGVSDPVVVRSGDTVDVTLTLRATVRMTGRVVDESGRPVADAGISASPARPGLGRVAPTATSNEEGRFMLRGVPTSDRKLRVSHPRFKSTVQDFAVDGSVEEIAVGDLVLRRGAGIEGRLVDEKGMGLGATPVYLQYDLKEGEEATAPDPNEKNFANAVTRADGSFGAFGLREGSYRVRVQIHDRFVESPTVRTGTTDLVLVARKGFVWQATILGDGKPLQQARVMARMAGTDSARSTWIESAGSDEQGRVRLTKLPPNGTFNLRVTHGDYQTYLRKNVRAGDLPTEIRMVSGFALEGVVTDTDGKPIAGVGVQASTKTGQGNAWRGARTDEEGRFRISGLEQIEYSLRVTVVPGNQIRPEPRKVTPGGDAIRLELTTGLSIEGAVKTSKEATFPFIRIEARDADDKVRQTGFVVPRTQLRFELRGLPPGNYTVRFVTGWGDTEKERARLTDVAAGTKDLEVEIRGQ